MRPRRPYSVSHLAPSPRAPIPSIADLTYTVGPPDAASGGVPRSTQVAFSPTVSQLVGVTRPTKRERVRLPRKRRKKVHSRCAPRADDVAPPASRGADRSTDKFHGPPTVT